MRRNDKAARRPPAILVCALPRPPGWRVLGRRIVGVTMRLWCQECGKPSSPDAKGWRLYRSDVPKEDDEPSLAACCAACAYVEFGGSSRKHPESD